VKKSLLIIFSFLILTSLRSQNTNSQRTEAEAKILIDSLYKNLINGADFKTTAKTYSEDPGSNRYGGEYDSITKGLFVPEFEIVVFSLKVNEISKPFKTEYGYHIAMLIARRNDEVDVRHILIQYRK